MRIVGGQNRGRTLASPKGLATRPTSDRTRESIFNILQHAGWLKSPAVEDATVLDVFAGTGAMGLEALSRGAKHCVFVDNMPAAAGLCRDNIDSLGETERSRIIPFDAENPLPRPLYIEQRSLVFIDPPYGRESGSKALRGLMEKNWLADEVVCVMEMSKKHPEAIPDGFALRDERAYGITLVRFLQRNQEKT